MGQMGGPGGMMGGGKGLMAPGPCGLRPMMPSDGSGCGGLAGGTMPPLGSGPFGAGPSGPMGPGGGMGFPMPGPGALMPGDGIGFGCGRMPFPFPGGAGLRPGGALTPMTKSKAWPVFVGNVAFDTEEDEVGILFRDCPGLTSFRLAKEAVGGGSRGFGFAEFDEPVQALEAIKKIDGHDIRGRRLRLRWGENAPTTPEVDEFHKAPERWKTRPCYELHKGMVCPRGAECPYAHSDAELRRLGDRAPDAGAPPGPPTGALETATAPQAKPKPETVKLLVPFADFPGSGDEEKQKAAYSAVLGTGASNIRSLMKKTGCRLQLRGTGGGDAGKGEDSKEQLHVVVRPGMDGKPPSDEIVETITRAIEDIVAKATGKELAKRPEAEDSTAKALAEKSSSEKAVGEAGAGDGEEREAARGSRGGGRKDEPRGTPPKERVGAVERGGARGILGATSAGAAVAAVAAVAADAAAPSASAPPVMTPPPQGPPGAPASSRQVSPRVAPASSAPPPVKATTAADRGAEEEPRDDRDAEAAPSPPEPKRPRREPTLPPCPAGAGCTDPDCAKGHPRLPGLDEDPDEDAKLQFFVMRPSSVSSLQTSVRHGAWATSKSGTELLEEALSASEHVVLIFSAAETGHFQGYARITSPPDRRFKPGIWGRKADRLGHSMRVSWLKQCMLPFSQTDGLKGDSDDAASLRKGRDGQEVPTALGEKLARLMHQQRSVDLLTLPADDEDDAEADLLRGASRSRSRGARRSSGGRSGEARDRNNNVWVPPSGAPAPSAWGPSGGPAASASGAPAWSQKPAAGWSLSGPAPAHPAAAPGWGPPYGAPPGWGGYYPPPGAFHAMGPPGAHGSGHGPPPAAWVGSASGPPGGPPPRGGS